jgi:hypothetical protein
VPLVQVPASRAAVDLDHRAVLGRRGDHLLDVEVVGLALQQEPSARVPEAVHQRVRDRLDHPRGHPVLADAEGGVDARDDPVELVDEVVLVVEPAVRADVDLRT